MPETMQIVYVSDEPSEWAVRPRNKRRGPSRNEVSAKCATRWERNGARPAEASSLNAILEKYWRAGGPHSSVDGSSSMKELFDHDLSLWRSETRFSSNLAAQLSHPAYFRMIAMGRAALPWIFDDLQKGGGHWFVALRAITREDPVPPEHRSLPRLMREDWLKWGASEGLTNDKMDVRSEIPVPNRTEISEPEN